MEKMRRKPRFLSDLGRSSTLPDLLEKHSGFPRVKGGPNRYKTMAQNLERKNVELAIQLSEERMRNRELKEKLEITQRQKKETLERFIFEWHYSF